MIEDDPVLGAFVSLHPSDRLRPLLVSAVIGGIVGLALFVLLSVNQARWVEPFSAVVMGVVTLALGWYTLHLWNREVLLFERGFTYREGSRIISFLYSEIRSVRQQGERLAYFGGRVRRDVHKITLTTHQGETLVLTDIYRRAGEMGAKLEAGVNKALRPLVDARLMDGKAYPFGAGLAVSSAGIHSGDQLLSWGDFGGYKVEGRQLRLLDTSGAVWASAPLSEVENITLLIDLLREKATAGGVQKLR